MNPQQPFVHSLSSGLQVSDEPASLPPDLQDEVDRRCEEIRRARAEAELTSREYLIY